MATDILTQKQSAEELARLVLQLVKQQRTKTDRAFALFAGANSLIQHRNGGCADDNVTELLEMGFETLGDASELNDLQRTAESFLSTVAEA
jgi:hypothetical protein